MTDDDSTMLEIGSQLLLGLPGPSKFQALHMGCILEISDTGYTLEFEIEELDCEAGQTGRIFFQSEGEFVQQAVVVDGMVEGAPIPTARVTTVGEPVSAEGRQHPRISTVASELIATVGGEGFCPVVDLSRTGFAVMSSESHEVGDIVEVTIENGGNAYTGTACIQSCKELWEGRYRYGLYCCDADDSECTLKSGLIEISDDLHTLVE